MDRGRNLEALAEEDDEEDMEEHVGDESDSDGSSSSDDEPDEGTKRGEPNKFDIHCDGVGNAMALVHTALEELLEMKDLMLKHNLPPPLLIKLTTNTGKVFRSVNDLDSSVNELVRLVRVYSTPWEEKSAALKKLHEDYEIKQRQLNIAIKRLQLVDTHSKRIAREKRVMNWEKLFAKMMSNKGHGRRWKFLIETIKQKAKLGLEHVQEYTKALEESSDEEEEEMPTIQLKRHGTQSPASASDKQSEDESQKEDEEGTGQEEEAEVEKGAEGEPGAVESGSESEAEDKGIPSIKIELEEASEGDDEELSQSRSPESAKRVRFAANDLPPVPKVETHDASVSTETPDYDKFLFVRMYTPVNMKQEEMKCSVTFGKQFYKTKKLESAIKKADGSEPSVADIKKGGYEEAMFTMPDTVPDGIWQPTKPKELPPQNCQISVHSGPMDMIVAMATIDLADLKELDLREIFLPPPHGDDDVPKTPEPPDDDDLNSLSSDMEIPLPDDDKKSKEEPAKEDYVKDVDPMMFPLYSLDGSTSTHKPCGKLPLIFYWGKKARPLKYNRQVGTHGVHDLVFELTGIDLETTTKDDLQKDMLDVAVSPVDFAPKVQDRAISVIRFTPEEPPPGPTPSPEIQEHISPKRITPEHISPDLKQEMLPKYEFDKLMEKHSKDILIVQEEYEQRLQSLLSNIQAMEQTQALHQQQIMHQQTQIQQQQRQLSAARKSQEKRRTTGSATHSPVPTVAPPVTPAKQIGPATDEVSQPIVHPPMPPQKKRRAPPRPHMPQPPQYKSWEGIPEDFLERLDYFEYLSYQHKQDLLDKTKQEIQEDIEKKLAGQHKLSKKDEAMYEALNDVSLPALFMPFTRGTVFNPRAHQYFHPTGSNNMRLTQPPSVFQLPPLQRSKSSILNLFELSKNFNSRGQGWLMDRYIQQQEPVKNAHGVGPQPSAPTSRVRSPAFTPQHTLDLPPAQNEETVRQRILEQEAEC